jgi:hypothetical protein
LPPAIGQLREAGLIRLAMTGTTPFFRRAALQYTLRVFLLRKFLLTSDFLVRGSRAAGI